MVPFAFPVPSYASEAFLDEATRYFHALGPTLAPLVYPDGPIVMLQVDNEGALYFRDGAYDQDYHPDAIARVPRLPAREIPDARRAPGRLPERRSRIASAEGDGR